MPVSCSPGPLPAQSADVKGVTASQILRAALPPTAYATVDTIKQCLIGGRAGRSPQHKIAPNRNGFVDTVLSAYRERHALVVRPDDVWLAIVSQLGFYLGAEREVRDARLVAAADGDPEICAATTDLRALSRAMGDVLAKNVVEPALPSWIVPDFSTTTQCDVTVGSMLVLTTLKRETGHAPPRAVDQEPCGIPRVTLEGEREDWQNVLERLERLKDLGLKAIAWYHILQPIIQNFIDAFDKADTDANHHFWNTAAFSRPLATGSTLTGWLSAFCIFAEDGEWRGPKLTFAKPKGKTAAPAPETLPAKRFWTTYNKTFGKNGLEYPAIDVADVPPSYGELTIVLIPPPLADAATPAPSPVKCTLIAGLVGLGISSSRDTALSESGRNDSVRPVVAWWIVGKREARRRTKSVVIVAAETEREREEAIPIPAPTAEPIEAPTLSFAVQQMEPEAEPQPVESFVSASVSKKSKKKKGAAEPEPSEPPAPVEPVVVPEPPQPEPVPEPVPAAPVEDAWGTTAAKKGKKKKVGGAAAADPTPDPPAVVPDEPAPVVDAAPLEPEPPADPVVPQPEPVADTAAADDDWGVPVTAKKGKKDKGKGKNNAPVKPPTPEPTPQPEPEQEKQEAAPEEDTWSTPAATGKKGKQAAKKAAKKAAPGAWGVPGGFDDDAEEPEDSTAAATQEVQQTNTEPTPEEDPMSFTSAGGLFSGTSAFGFGQTPTPPAPAVEEKKSTGFGLGGWGASLTSGFGFGSSGFGSFGSTPTPVAEGTTNRAPSPLAGMQSLSSQMGASAFGGNDANFFDEFGGSGNADTGGGRRMGVG
ncbi:hypothetical protein HMN09_00536600 [Mycena chlorophos]|uniref:Uncharacterized protein n=1 Tax=Mycena chlorophos TaxID=658473 RepID=A0A8H6T9X4_MYCCL|nr:hypothetical protein HMN09_00536600 [Mycena chlorophos]